MHRVIGRSKHSRGRTTHRRSEAKALEAHPADSDAANPPAEEPPRVDELLPSEQEGTSLPCPAGRARLTTTVTTTRANQGGPSRPSAAAVWTNVRSKRTQADGLGHYFSGLKNPVSAVRSRPSAPNLDLNKSSSTIALCCFRPLFRPLIRPMFSFYGRSTGPQTRVLRARCAG